VAGMNVWVEEKNHLTSNEPRILRLSSP